MRVLVTGAAGTIGTAVVGELTSRGHEVVALDLVASAYPSNGVVRTVRADVTSADDVRQAAMGCDGVIHLAGYVEPDGAAPHEVFATNVVGTYVTLQALVDAGGRRAVLASSASALGMAWSPVGFSPLYAPIDELHPMLPADPYGLSKATLEHVGAMFHRRYAMSVAALRFPWAPNDEQRWERIERVSHDPGHEGALRDLWSYVHPADVAAAAVLALEADGLGFEVFNIVAADTLSDIPTRDLIDRFHPGTQIRAEIPGTSAAWTYEKARRMLGYSPTYSWRADARAPREAR